MNLWQSLTRSDKELTLGGYWDLLQQLYGGQFPTTTTTMDGSRVEPVPNSLEGYATGAYKSDGIVFACMAVRFLLFSEMRFAWRLLRNGEPGELSYTGGRGLELLRNPWPNATTKDLLRRMILDADLAGNWYGTVRRGQIKRMRPDWVYIVLGSDSDPDDPDPEYALDASVLGYVYMPSGRQDRIEFLLPEEVAHFAPYPDPIAHFRGMSWLTPVLREVDADKAATAHKLEFFRHAATPNMVIKHQTKDHDKVKRFAKWFKQEQEGLANAYRTLHLAEGADTEVVGRDFQQLDFKATQGAGETRISVAAGVPAVILGISEGLHGSSLNQGNYSSARRRLSDGTMHPLWSDAAGSLASIVREPANTELWYDVRGIPWLQEDRKDDAEIHKVEADTIRTLTDAGFAPDSVIAAVRAGGDWSRLRHTNLFSVQLQKPGENNGDPGRQIASALKTLMAQQG